MKPWQTLVKYGAIAFAVILIVNIAVWSLTAIGFIFGLSSSGTTDEPKVTEIAESVDKLDIELSAASLTISTAYVDHITVTTNLKDLTVKENNGKLTVKEKQKIFNVTHTDAYVEIVLPLIEQGCEVFSPQLKDVDIEMGGGILDIMGLNADEFELALGAGEANLRFLYIKKADIEGGAGDLSISGGEYSELDLEMGVGELEMVTVLSRAEVNVGIGNADITLLGNKDDYKLVLAKGIGGITVDGENVGNSTVGNGECKVKVNGGIGDIKICFGFDDPEDTIG